MTKFISSLVLAASILAGAGAANASPGNALKELAQAGTITPGGVFDGR